jgi:putative ABC transport system permease protein
MRDDVRHSLRLLRKTPGFTLVAIVMLALGTGANAALFSVVDAVLLRSPYGRLDEIAQVGTQAPNGRATVAVSRKAYLQLAARNQLVVAAATYTPSSPVATAIDVPRRVQAECVPASMIDVLGAQPLMGRWFTAEEDRAGAPGVAVVSFRFWKNDLHADPSVLGRGLTLDGEPVTIVGVMRRGFAGILSIANRDLWVPSGQTTASRPLYGCRAPSDFVNAFVRLRPGLSAEEGTRHLSDAFTRSGLADADARLVLLSMSDQLLGSVRGPFAALVGAVLAVLLIACANVANLGLERLAGRQRELAVRIALGAGRARIVRQVLVEHSLIAMAGSAVGLFVAYLAMDALVALLPSALPHLDDVRLNARVLVATLAVAIVGVLGAGLFPALRTSAVDMRAGLTGRDRGMTRGTHAIRRAFVVSQLALGAVLLTGALLMIQTFLVLRPSNPGFDARDKSLALVRLPATLAPAERFRFFEQVVQELRGIGGIRDVAGTTYVPMSRAVDVLEMTIGDSKGRVFAGSVSPNYFETIAVPIRRGRTLLPNDRIGAPNVALINESFVRRWLDGREPLGSSIHLALGEATTTVQVVGVIADMRSWGADTLARPELYLPMAQTMLGSPYFVVRADPRARAALGGTMREIVQRARPNQLVDRVESFAALIDAEVARPRFGAWLFGLLAGLAVLLSAIGLAATLSWIVAERRREIGIRMALGARPHQVSWLVTRQALILSLSGTAFGLTAAAFGTRLLEGWLYGVTPLDPATFAMCAAGMAIISLAAAYAPTRRATRVDPLISIKAE